MADYQGVKAGVAFHRIPSPPVDHDRARDVATEAATAAEESISAWQSKYGPWPGGTDDWIEEARAAGLTADEAMNWPIDLVKTHIQGHRRWLQAKQAAVGRADGPARRRETDPAEDSLAETLLTAVQVGAPDLAEELRLARDKTRPLRNRLADLFRKHPRFRTQSYAALGRVCDCSGEWIRKTIEGSKALQEARNRKNLQ